MITTGISYQVSMAILKALDQALQLPERDAERVAEAIQNIAKAARRDAKKRQSDERTDKVRRVLVGARIPRKEAERCRSCARNMGESMYKFAFTALLLRCFDVERSKGLHWTGNAHVRAGG